MPLDLVKQIVDASLEFGYYAKANGATLEKAKERYNEIMEELLVKWNKENGVAA